MSSARRSSLPPLPFEQPLLAIEEKIVELETLSRETGAVLEMDIQVLKLQAGEARERLYHHLTAAQKLQLARHSHRPNLLEVAHMLSPDTWFELRGDRGGCDDRAIIGGIIELGRQPAMVVGTQKGRGMKENLNHNFGMANPEGYRKALRLFRHAEKFRMPVITMIDTPGAYPGMHGEQFSIGQAIALNIREMARLRVPILSVVLGEGCSGGALGIGVSNLIYMLEHAVYTVISPEGCASILWRDAAYADQAANAMKITAQDLLEQGIIDGIIQEPMGGAHQDPVAMVLSIREQLLNGLETLQPLGGDELVQHRYNKFRHIGAYKEKSIYATMPV